MTEVKNPSKRQDKFCPICGKSENRNFFPFCSKSCADLDLGKWLTEDYRIPIDEEDMDEESYDMGC